ncbi:DUF397 domain-containing protein [Streptomyces sp. CB01249]|uniref:DUF397 domain-containing protein n=1 Tax=Streptomyces sp. CB01249 TaxID=1703929 RepID=UPI003FCF0782
MRATPDLSVAHWRKSGYSTGDSGSECAEVADGLDGLVPVRDSKTPLPPRCSSPQAHGTRSLRR